MLSTQFRNFIGNLTDLLGDRNQSTTRWSREETGNHWTAYKGYDLDGDGIGDVPHKIQNVFQIMEGDIPEIRFYLLSPVAEILDAAERSLPILSLEADKDYHPLFRPVGNNDVLWEFARKKTTDNVDKSENSGSTTRSKRLSALFYLLISLSPAGWLFGSRR